MLSNSKPRSYFSNTDCKTIQAYSFTSQTCCKPPHSQGHIRQHTAETISGSDGSLNAARKDVQQPAVHLRGEVVVGQQLAVNVPGALGALGLHLQRRHVHHVHKVESTRLDTCGSSSLASAFALHLFQGSRAATDKASTAS